MNRELYSKFNSGDWHLYLATTPGLKEINKEVGRAKKLISKRGETITANKIVAELTFGFWSRLLNAEYERILWKTSDSLSPIWRKKTDSVIQFLHQ